MARAPRGGSGPCAPQSAPRVSLPCFYRLGSSNGSTGDLTARGRRSVHGGCATAGRRGTDLLAGRRRTRRVTAGVRTLSGKRASGGPRTGLPGAGEATSAHAPARPLVNGRRGGTASTRLAGTAPHPRAESADTKLAARPARECDPGTAARSAASPGNLPPALVSVPGDQAGFGVRGDRHGSRAERQRPHDFARQPAFHPATPPGRLPGR